MTDTIEYQVNSHEYYIKTHRLIHVDRALANTTLTFEDENSDYSLELTELELYDRLNQIAAPVLTGGQGDYFLNNFSPSLYAPWNDNTPIPPFGRPKHVWIPQDAVLNAEIDANRHTILLKIWGKNASGGIEEHKHVFHSTEDIDALLADTNERLASFPPGVTDFDFNGGSISSGRNCGFALRTFPSTATIPAGLTNAGSTIYVQHIVLDLFTLCRRAKNYKVKITDETIESTFLEKPCYLDLVTGYRLDKRKIPQQISVKSSIDKVIALGFYRNNPYEQVNDLTAIDYAEKRITLKGNVEKLVDVEGLVLGTLHASDLNIVINSSPSGSGFYELAQMAYDSGNIASLFAYWLTLYDEEVAKQVAKPPFDPIGKTLLKEVIYTSTNGELKLLAAFNDHWHNATLGNDIGADIDHPLFAVDEATAYKYHFKPRSNGSFGDLEMDSPRIVELHDRIEQIATALDSEKYSINDVDPALPRVSNLGWHINRLSEVLGIRVDANGVIDREKEKTKYNPQILNNPQYAEGDYGVTCWGKYGMVIPRLITEYDGSGQVKQPYHVVYDLPQIVRAFQGDIDTALSLQHGTEIRTRDIDGKVGKYPNQLALMLDLHRRTQAIELYSQRSYNLNTVSNAEIRGLYGGLGIPVSQQFINATNLVGKTGVNRKLPYFSYQKGQQTIASRFTTVEVNLGIILGTIMPKSQTEKQKILNPFKRFGAAK